MSLLPLAESFGDEERGIRKFTRVEASEHKESQRTVLKKFLWKMACKADMKWTAEMEKQEMPHKSVLVVTCEDTEIEIQNV